MSKTCGGGDAEAEKMEELALRGRMGKIDKKFIVLSGKGGVGKSTVAANLAAALARKGMRTGLLDVDLHGPSIPGLLGIKGLRLEADENGAIRPFAVNDNLKVVSIGLLTGSEQDAFIWRGPMKYGVIKELLKDVEWGVLDCLVIDSPPGTGDEPLSVAQLAGENAFAVVVTTPQARATDDVRRSLSFCSKLSMPVAGIVENMSGYVCPSCGERSDVFGSGGGERLASESGVPFLGRIPLDPGIMSGGEAGRVFVSELPESAPAKAFDKIVAGIIGGKESEKQSNGEGKMRIAIPTAGKKLCMHFGHCDEFAILDVDASNRIVGTEYVTPPPHEPGLLPKWLHEMGVNAIIAGGMGQRAQGLFEQNSIKVVTGAPSEPPEALAEKFLSGTLATGENTCDH